MDFWSEVEGHVLQLRQFLYDAGIARRHSAVFPVERFVEQVDR
jgi:hypothetical protein